MPERPSSPDALLIMGASHRCGKSVAMAGLAMALKQEGFQVSALKPLMLKCFAAQPPLSLDWMRGGQEDPMLAEQTYFNQMTGQFAPEPPLVAANPQEVSALDWSRVLDRCRKQAFPALIETVGSVATPVRLDSMGVFDNTDLARALDVPVVLVVRSGLLFLEEALLSLTYLAEHQIPVLGFLSVETHPETTLSPEDGWALDLTQRFEVPFLGRIPFSPSISVEGRQQGNIIRLTEEHIDLLPLQRALKVTL